MSDIIHLGPEKLLLASLLIILLGGVSWLQKLGVARSIFIAALRAVVQLSLIGMVLTTLFAVKNPFWIFLIAMVMLLAAGREVMMRQTRRLSGWYGYGLALISMMLSSLVIAIAVLTLIISPTPWYTPQYAIPILGMMLGNTMNAISLSVETLNQNSWRERRTIEARLILGHHWFEAITPIYRQAIRTGMIPMINSMAAAGLVSLPGMMTGQILGGNPPMVAVQYQILLLFMIATGTGLGTMAAVWLSARRLFDDRQRLRLDRLTKIDS
ncbi:ABC transporter permease [Magnetococcales bacterium HHB-1]